MSLNIVAWHDRTLRDHLLQSTTWSAKGFRTKSLCVYGDRADPRYACVMILRPVITLEHTWHYLSAAEFQQTFNEQAAQGFGPFIVSATGPVDNPLFAVAFHPVSSIPLTRFGLSATDLAAENAAAYVNNLIPIWVDAYGVPGDIRYVGIWVPNPAPTLPPAQTQAQTAWAMDGVADDQATTQARFDSTLSARGRLAHIALDPEQKFLTIFVDNQIGSSPAADNLTSQQYQAKFDAQMKVGLAPVCVSAEGVGSNARFAAIFAANETPVPRTFRKSIVSVEVPAIDTLVESVMKVNDARGMSLAILDGARLVYARGYTWAEPNYTDIQPTTLFRQASVSKTFTALAIYQLIEEMKKLPNGTVFTLDTTVQSVLNFPKLDQSGAPGQRFENITIRHLLEMTSGMQDTWWSGDVMAVGQANLPASGYALAAYSATLPLTNPPGAMTKVTYNNTGYETLGLVVATLRGTLNNLVAAITPTVLTPLHMNHVRAARSLVANQAADEAFYYPRYLPVMQPMRTSQLVTYPSLMTPDERLVPMILGTPNLENCVGGGGISASAVDIARLIAIFNIAGDTPVLKEATRTTMLQNALNASKNYSGPDPHGYHGFDTVQTADGAGNYIGSKGGYLWTSQNAHWFQMGGFSYVWCTSGNIPNDLPGSTWFSQIQAAAQAHTWPAGDLFPTFKMPSFKTKKLPAAQHIAGTTATQHALRGTFEKIRARASKG